MVQHLTIVPIATLSHIEGAHIPQGGDSLVSAATPRIGGLVDVLVARHETSPLQSFEQMVLHSVLCVFLDYKALIVLSKIAELECDLDPSIL